MKLSLPYLYDRHRYWLERIGEAGIWDVSLFRPVHIFIRPACKSYNALFTRRIKMKNGKREILDRIFIYNKSEEFDPKYLDSLIVHETIHQYIIQNQLKDTSTHGRLFRSFMKKINESFAPDLQIKISDRNPDMKLKGPGVKTHSLLLLNLSTGQSYCCIVNPGKKEYFHNQLQKHAGKWKVKSYCWAKSKDVYFNQFTRCTKSLHGIRMDHDKLSYFCLEYGVTSEA